MSLLAAFAPTDGVFLIARLGGGLAAGMAYPTTLALITALWSGPGRTEVDRAVVGVSVGRSRRSARSLSGLLLEHFWWGSVFLVTLPLAVVALLLAFRIVPAHVNEGTDPVDNLGGILSVVMVGRSCSAINFAAVPNTGTLVLGLAAIVLAARRRVRDPPTSGRQPAL